MATRKVDQRRRRVLLRGKVFEFMSYFHGDITEYGYGITYYRLRGPVVWPAATTLNSTLEKVIVKPRVVVEEAIRLKYRSSAAIRPVHDLPWDIVKLFTFMAAFFETCIL